MNVLYQLNKQTGKAKIVLLFDVFNGFSISIKEINSLIWKRMSNIYYWEKLIFSKLRFFEKENLKKCTNFEEQKGTTYIRRNVIICITVFSCFSSTKSCLKFLLNCFVQETKGFYQSSLENEVDFKDRMKMKEQWLKQHKCLPVTGKHLHLFSCEKKDKKMHF